VVAQLLLHHPRLMVAAIEDGVVGKGGAVFELVRLQPHHHAFGFVFVVFAGNDLDWIANAEVAPQLLFEQLGVVGDHRVGGAQNARYRAVVLLQLDHFQLGEIFLQQPQVFHIRTAPGVDRLVVVTHGGEHALAAGQQLHQLILAGVGVLVFVQQQVAQLVLPFFQYRCVFLEQFHRQADQVVEVHRLIGEQRVLIDAVDLGCGQFTFVGGLVQRLIGGDEIVFPARNHALDMADFGLVGGFDDFRNDLETVGRIQHRKLRFVTEMCALLAQNLHPQRVKSTHRQPACRLAFHQMFHPLLHLARGLVGKGDRSDIACIHAALLDQVGDLGGNHPRFATAGASQHQERAIQIFGGFALRGVEFVEHRNTAKEWAAILTWAAGRSGIGLQAGLQGNRGAACRGGAPFGQECCLRCRRSDFNPTYKDLFQRCCVWQAKSRSG
jgi:hypothetical protein